MPSGDPVAKIYDPIPSSIYPRTASGYGKKLTSSCRVKYSDGSTRRVYVTCYSNAGTAWVVINKRHVVLSDGLLMDLPIIIDERGN